MDNRPLIAGSIAFRARNLAVVFLAGLTLPLLAEEAPQWSFERAHVLPSELKGLPGKVHTQGLLVTDQFFYVTGRHETPPKRALLMRFERTAPDKHEWLDITPPVEEGSPSTSRLDHPGGFDVDSTGALVIPVSTSHRRGPSLIYRIETSQQVPLKKTKVQTVAKLADHLGALCIDRQDQSVYAANWDTLHLYHWKQLTSSATPQKIASRTLFAGQGPWPLAIQDWKGLPGGKVVAGGIDKSPERDASTPRAVVQLLDLRAGTIVHSLRLPDRADVRRPLTNEGLCWTGNRLYLLPEDIGQGAKVLEFRRR